MTIPGTARIPGVNCYITPITSTDPQDNPLILNATTDTVPSTSTKRTRDDREEEDDKCTMLAVLRSPSADFSSEQPPSKKRFMLSPPFEILETVPLSPLEPRVIPTLLQSPVARDPAEAFGDDIVVDVVDEDGLMEDEATDEETVTGSSILSKDVILEEIDLENADMALEDDGTSTLAEEISSAFDLELLATALEDISSALEQQEHEDAEDDDAIESMIVVQHPLVEEHSPVDEVCFQTGFGPNLF